MPSKLEIIATAVAHELNTTDFGRAFVAAVEYLPECERKDLQALRVTVVPRKRDIEGATRNTSHIDYTIDIGVRQVVANDGLAEVGPHVQLVEAISNHFVRRRLSTYPAGIVKRVEEFPLSEEHLREQRVVFGVVTLTLRDCNA